MKTENQSFDHQSYEALKNKLLQSDIDLTNHQGVYVSLEISKSTHSRMFVALSVHQKENALYNLDKFLHQVLDKWEQDAFQQNHECIAKKPSHWLNQFRKK